MTTGQMRERISIFNPKDVDGPYIDVPVELKDLDLVAEVAAKKEDRISPSIWGTKAEERRDNKQFVIRYRRGLREGITKIMHNTDLYTITAIAEPGNNRQWLILLADRTAYIGL